MHSPDWTDAAVTTVGVRALLVLGAHDGDAEGDPLVVVAVTAPAHGVTKTNDDGTITYRPAPGFMGQDSFTYTRSDGAVEGTGAVAVTVELVGTDGDDALAGPAVDRNVIHGLEGADTLRITGTGSSEIRVRVGDVGMTGFVFRPDLVHAGAGNAPVFGEWSGNSHCNEAGAGRLEGPTPDEALIVRSGDDDLEGGHRVDTIDGVGEDDRLTGGSGDDTRDGGQRTETAVFDFDLVQHDIQLEPEQVLVAASIGSEDVDTRIGIERFLLNGEAYELVDGQLRPLQEPASAVSAPSHREGHGNRIVADTSPVSSVSDNDPDADARPVSAFTQQVSRSVVEHGDGSVTDTREAGFVGTKDPTDTQSDTTTPDMGNFNVMVNDVDEPMAGTVLHSSALGWAAGQNITAEMATLLADGTLGPDTALVLDHMYEIDSGAQLALPNDFTLAGDGAGSGLTVVNVLANGSHALTFGANNTFRDMTVLHTGTEPEGTKTNSTSFDGNDDLSIINSYFEGNVGTFVNVLGDQLVVKNSHFNGGYWALTVNGTDTAEIRNTLFENSLGDGIKTTKAEKSSSNFIISGSVFLNNTRDGIDTTGGFRDSVVENSYFVKNMLGMDIKSHYAEASHLGKSDNINILIRGSEFITNNRAIVIATADKTVDQNWEAHRNSNLLTNNDWNTYSPHDIHLENSIIEYDTNVGHQNGSDVFHLKGASGVNYDTIELLGNVDAFLPDDGWRYGNIDPTVYNSNYSGTNLTTGDPRPQQPDSYYRSLAGTDFALDEAPDATDDAATTTEGSAVTVDVLSNDSDVDGDPLTMTVATGPTNGTAVIDDQGTPDPSDDTISYTPNVGVTGSDSFTYTIDDGQGGSDSATVTVTVSDPAVNSAPVATDDTATTTEGTAVTVDVLANDSDPLTITVAKGPTNGTAVIDDQGTPDPSDDTIVYTPNAGFTGSDSFTYTIDDGQGGSDTATVTVTVGTAAPTAAINAGGDAFTTAAGVAYSADQNFSGGNTYTTGSAIAGTDDDALYQSERWASGGFSYSVPVADGTYQVRLRFAEIYFNAAGERVFDVAAEGATVVDDLDIWSAAGGQNVAYDETVLTTVADGSLDLDFLPVVENPKVSAIEITPADGSPPAAADDAATTDEDTAVTVAVLANDSDPDGDPLTITGVGTPANGTAVIDDQGTTNPSDDTVTYAPAADFNGADSFTYTVGDGTFTTTATVDVSVTAVNDAPVATGALFVFQLVDAGDDRIIDDDLSDGVQGLTVDDLAGPLAVAAVEATAGTVGGAVDLTLTGPEVTVTKTEGVTPYAIFGDSGGDYAGEVLAEGAYTFSATHEGVTETVNFDLTEPAPVELALSVDPPTLAENGGSATGTVARSGSTADDLVVSLSSSDVGEATVPAELTISAGAASATFEVGGVDDSEVDGAQTVTLAATAPEARGASTTIEVTDDDVASDPEPETGALFVFQLVDAGDDRIIDDDLSDGVQGLTADDLAGPLAVAAVEATAGTVGGAVDLTLTGPAGTRTKTEGVAPYAIFGDSGGDYAGEVLAEGAYTFSATHEGVTETVDFELVA